MVRIAEDGIAPPHRLEELLRPGDMADDHPRRRGIEIVI